MQYDRNLLAWPLQPALHARATAHHEPNHHLLISRHMIACMTTCMHNSPRPKLQLKSIHQPTAMSTHHHLLLPIVVSLLLLSSLFSGGSCTTFTLTNSCGYTVWPGLLSSAGTAALDTTGFALAPGESRAVEAPGAWSGRIWGRTLCGSDRDSGRFACATCDCGSGLVECAGGGAAPPCSLAEFTLAGSGGNDFYDVSLVDGSNLPMVVIPQGGAGASCGATGCLVDLNGPCPADLRVAGPDGAGIACKSACEAFQRPEDCCSGDYGSPATCQPSAYSLFFKNACPRAYSYAYDDATSTFTCTSGTASYFVVFCPTSSSLKSSVIGGTNPSEPLVNDTVSYLDRGSDRAHGWLYDAPRSSHGASPSAPPSPLAFATLALTWLCFTTRRHWLSSSSGARAHGHRHGSTAHVAAPPCAGPTL